MIPFCLVFLAASADPPAKPASPLRPVTVRSLAFTPDGTMLLAAFGLPTRPGGVAAWSVDSRNPLWRYDSPTGCNSLSFAVDGKSLALTHGKGTALRLDPANGKSIGEIGEHPTRLTAVTHIPNSNLLATGSDGMIRFWDLKTGKLAKELKGHQNKLKQDAQISALVASPDGKWLIATNYEGSRLWNLATFEEAPDYFDPDGGQSGILFIAPDRLYGTNWGSQVVREFPRGKELMKFKSAGGAWECAYSAKAGLIANRWHSSNEAWISDLTFRAPTEKESAAIAKLLTDFDDDSYAVREAAAKAMRAIGSVAEPMLRAAMKDGPSAEARMRAREARKAILETPLRELTGHTDVIGPMAFSPDGKLFATGADDGTVRLWDSATGKQLAVLPLSEATP